MEWLPTGLLASAGPWVALVSVTLAMLLGLFVAIRSGTLVTATQVDKIVAAYESMLASACIPVPLPGRSTTLRWPYR